MYRLKPTDNMTSDEVYDYIRELISQQILDESDPIANMSNISAILMNTLRDLNWAGFYLMKENVLVLGPFQGLPACNRIKVGEGVCGSAVSEKQSMLVEDVESFPGHIACDSASKSELVVPIILNDVVVGVLDLDSPIKNRFTIEDKENLEEIISQIGRYLIG